MSNFERVPVVTFGRYYKGNDKTLQPLEWVVLAEYQEHLLLFSKNIIDAKAYDNPPQEELIERVRNMVRSGKDRAPNSVYWCECSLRKWLNSDFINIAFTEQEYQNIAVVTNRTSNTRRMALVNFLDSSTEVEGGPDVDDEVFLLSVEEVEHFFDSGKGVPTERINPALTMYTSEGDIKELDLTAPSTPYSTAKNLYYSNNNDISTGWWWLRNPGATHGMAAVVQNGNILYKPGECCNDETIGVRPAMWIRKDAL